MVRNHKTVSTTSNYIEHFLISVFIITVCISISAFESLLFIPVALTRSAMRLKICDTEIKKYKPIIKKQKQKHDKIPYYL